MEIRPFKAYRFDPHVVGNVGDCVAPPYDVISHEQQEELCRKSKYNIVRITKGKTTPSDDGQYNQYTRAAQYLNEWIQQGVLKQDTTEAIYGYVQDFEVGGTWFRRLSFIAQAKLEEFGKTVRPHEQILKGPLMDRLNLERATAARFGLVFMLYEDGEHIAERIIEKAASSRPLVGFVDDHDVQHHLFAITSRQDTDAITAMMRDKSCIIADGHHRYTTGLTYSKESGNPAARYQMLAFTNACHEGLMVLATHRLVGGLKHFDIKKLIAGLAGDFELTRFAFDATPGSKAEARGEMLTAMKHQYAADRNALGIYGADGGFYVAVLKDRRLMDPLVPNMSAAWRGLDVSVLHKLILEKLLGLNDDQLARGDNLAYVKDTPSAIDDSIPKVDAGQRQVAFFMNPVKMQQLKMVTDAGERMPQKSTYFYPKMYTGLTIDKL